MSKKQVNIQEPIVSNNSYSISKIKKLIDINHDMINFKLLFRVTSPENKHFDALIIDQTTLDNTPHENLEYKAVEGSISGEVVADKNVYQNYYILLKSDIPMSVDVELQTTKLPDHITKSSDKKRKKSKKSGTKSDNLKYILIGIGIVVVLYFLICRSSQSDGGFSISSTHQSLLEKLRKVRLE